MLTYPEKSVVRPYPFMEHLTICAL